eukprot:2753316-Pleurochrysis_carterae.AAC.1
MALPVAVARPVQTSGANTDVHARPTQPVETSADAPNPDTPVNSVPSAPAASTRTHFQRSLGSFNLRSSQPSALLVTRRHRKFDAVSDA